MRSCQSALSSAVEKEKSCFSKQFIKKLIDHFTRGSALSPLKRFPWITAVFLWAKIRCSPIFFWNVSKHQIWLKQKRWYVAIIQKIPSISLCVKNCQVIQPKNMQHEFCKTSFLFSANAFENKFIVYFDFFEVWYYWLLKKSKTKNRWSTFKIKNTSVSQPYRSWGSSSNKIIKFWRILQLLH